MAVKKFADSVLIHSSVMEVSRRMFLALLYCITHQIQGIEVTSHIMPNVPSSSVFDTAFHQTMPKESLHVRFPYEYHGAAQRKRRNPGLSPKSRYVYPAANTQI